MPSPDPEYEVKVWRDDLAALGTRSHFLSLQTDSPASPAVHAAVESEINDNFTLSRLRLLKTHYARLAVFRKSIGVSTFTACEVCILHTPTLVFSEKDLY